MSNAAELIGKIEAQGVEKFESDMNKAGAAFDKLGKHAQATETAMKGAGNGSAWMSTAMVTAGSLISSGITTALSAFESGAISALKAFTDFTTGAIREAASLQQLRFTFQGLTGSKESGDQKVAWLNQFSKFSLGQDKDLQTFATRLEAGGLRMERIIPALDQMSAVFPNIRQGGEELTSAFMRSAAGRYADSMEIFSNAGISYGDLEGRKGIKVDKSHHIDAKPEDFIQAILDISKEKLGPVSKLVADAMNVAFSNVQDAWTRMTASFGETFFPVITKILNVLTPLMDFMRESGVLENIGKSFASMFDIGKGDAFVRIILYAVSIIEDIPNLLRMAWDYFSTVFAGVGKILQGIFRFVVEGIGVVLQSVHEMGPIFQKIGDMLDKVSQMQPIMAGFAAIMNPLGQAWNFLKMLGSPKKPWEADPVKAGGGKKDDWLKDWNKSMPSFNPEDYMKSLPRVGGYFTGRSKRTDDLMKLFDDYQKKPSPGMPDSSGPLFNKNHAASTLDEIKQNTAATAHHTSSLESFRKFALGGGDRGQVGLTPVEFYGRRSGGGSMTVDMGPGASKIEEGMAEAFLAFMQQYERAGAH